MGRKKKKNKEAKDESQSARNEGKNSDRQTESKSFVFIVKVWPETEIIKASQPSAVIKEAIINEYRKENTSNNDLSFTEVNFVTGNEFKIEVKEENAEAIRHLSSKGSFSYLEKSFQIVLADGSKTMEKVVSSKSARTVESCEFEATPVKEKIASESSAIELSKGLKENERIDVKLLVLYPSEEVDEEYLQLYFESPRNSGVKCEVVDIEKVCQGGFLLSFDDPSVVQVLAEKPHKYKGKNALVKIYDPKSAFDATAVIVSDLTDKIDQEILQLYFENEKNGGGSIKNIEIQNLKAVVKFCDEKDAKGVLDHAGHKVRGSHLKVEPYYIDIQTHIKELIEKDESGLFGNVQLHNISSECALAEESQQKKLFVQGLPEEIDKSYVELFFEDEKKSGGGEILSMELIGNSAIIEFKDPAVIDRVLRREKIAIKGKHLDVSMAVAPDNSHPKSILVTGNFMGKFDVTILEIFFENEKLSNGGDIEEILARDTDVLITFKDQNVAERVLMKEKYSYKGYDMYIKEYKKSESSNSATDPVDNETDENQRTVEIHGDIENIDKDLLMLFLQNPARSGGGEIEKVDLSASPPWVTFRQIQSASCIVSRDNLVLDKIKVVAKRYHKKQIKDNEIIIRNFSPRTTEDSVRCYIVNITKLEVKELAFSHDRQSVLAAFNNKIDWEVLKERHQKKSTLDGSTLEIMEVPVCKTLLISNIDGKTTRDGLQLTVEKPSLAGFDSIEGEVNFEEGSGYAIIQFKERNVVDKLLASSIVLDGVELIIDEFNPHFQTESVWQIANKPPEEIEIEVDSRILDFILSTRKSQICKLLNSEVYKKTDPRKGSARIFACFTPDQKIQNPKNVFQTFYNGFMTVFVKHNLVEANARMVNELKTKYVGCVIETLGRGIQITGECESVEKLKSEVTETLVKQVEEKKKREAIVEKCLPLPPARAELLSLTGYFDEVGKQFKVKVQRKNEELVFSGPETAIADVEKQLMTKILFYTQRKLKRSLGLCTNLSDQNRRQTAIAKVNTKNVKIVFTVDCKNEEITFSAFTEDSINRGIEIFDKSYGDIIVQATSEQESLLSNDKGSKFFAKLEKLHNVTISFDKLNIEVNGELQFCSIAEEKILDFLQNNSFHTRTSSTSVGMSNAILKLKSHEIKEIENAGREDLINIKLSRDSSGILISGLGNGVLIAFDSLRDLSKSVFSEDVLLERPGVTKLLKETHIKQAIRNIENEERVIIIEKSEDVISSCTDEETVIVANPFSTSNLICSFRTDQGQVLSVYRGDITKHKADAIVNPANNNLWFGCGVAGAILNAGGEIIQDECREYVKAHGEVDDGRAVATTGGRLPCKIVIHAVGPRWRSDNRHIGERELQSITAKCEKSLAEAMTEVLILANEKKMNTVAVPAISSGVFGFPKDLCAKILVESALKFCQRKSAKEPSEIHFVNVDDLTVETFRKEFDRRFGSSKCYTKTKPRPKERPLEKSYSWSNKNNNKVNRGVSSRDIGLKEQQNIPPASKKATVSSDVTIEIIVGDLAKQRVDVIVNSASEMLDLSKNPCARGLSDAAGSQLQDECNAYIKRRGQMSVWDCAVTPAFKLNCQKVVHAVCGRYDGVVNGPAEKGLRNMLQNILKHSTTSLGAKSIAIPALGTGILQFPRQKVAEILINGVEEFAKKNKSINTLKEVKLVAYHADQQTIDAFNATFKSRRANPVTSDTLKEPQETKTQPRERKSAAPNQSKFQSDDDNVKINLGNIILEVDQGDITCEKSDVIVVLGDEGLNFFGAVGSSVIKKEGNEFKVAAKNMAPQQPGKTCLIKTSKMRTKYVAHVYPKSPGYNDLTEATRKMFKICDKTGVQSVSIPAIGTGIIGKTAKESAQLILHTLAELCFDNSLQNICIVRVIVYEERMLSDFKTELSNVHENPGSYIKSNKPGLKTWLKDQFCSFFGFDSSTQSTETSGSSEKIQNISKFQFRPLNLVIYSISQSGITKARKKLEQILDINIRPLVTEIEQFKKLSDSQFNRIRKEAQMKDVMFEVDRQTGSVTLTGYHHDTTSMLDICFRMSYENIQEDAERDKENSLRDYIQWFEIQTDGTRIAYDAKLNYTIERHYKRQETKFQAEVLNDVEEISPFEINLKELTAKNLTNGDIFNIERKEITRDQNSGFTLPAPWDPMPKLANGLEKSYHLVELANNSKEFNDVKQIFMNSSSGTITNYCKIKRIQNPGLYQAFQAKKASMDNTSASGSNEMCLFHGTQPVTCDQISHFGFNRSFAGLNATVYGEGVYFARDSSYSTRYSHQKDSMGFRYMLLAKVLVGSFTQGRQGMKVPPSGYDTVTDSTQNPSMYVAFNDNQCYPEYLLLFQ